MQSSVIWIADMDMGFRRSMYVEGVVGKFIVMLHSARVNMLRPCITGSVSQLEPLLVFNVIEKGLPVWCFDALQGD